VLVARDDLGEWPEPGTRTEADRVRLLSNIVLMGMGEPLYNFESVRDAMKIAMDPQGIQLSRRRITLSTSGVVPEIARTAEEIGCQLAISFHATTDEVRDKLVPINKRWPLADLLEALRSYPKVSNSERGPAPLTNGPQTTAFASLLISFTMQGIRHPSAGRAVRISWPPVVS